MASATTDGASLLIRRYILCVARRKRGGKEGPSRRQPHPSALRGPRKKLIYVTRWRSLIFFFRGGGAFFWITDCFGGCLN